MIARSAFNPLNVAHMFACLGDSDAALEALHRATKSGPVRIGREIATPEYRTILRDPRMLKIRRIVGLPQEH